MIPLTEARRIIQSHVSALSSEDVETAHSLGRQLAEDIIASEDFPAFDRSAMDGYALPAGDDSPEWEVLGEIPAGSVAPTERAKGKCWRIYTGGMVPENCDRVVPQEWTETIGENRIRLTKSSDLTFIRRRGEDIRTGQTLLSAGTRIGPGEIAALATLGISRIRVHRMPRIGHLVTGDELVTAGGTPRPGEIRDSNSPLIAALLSSLGIPRSKHMHAPDDKEQQKLIVKSWFEEGLDLLFISGGASVGTKDHGKDVLRELGFNIHFERVDIRPGKPLVFATREKQAAFVLPGNPVSHFVVFHTAVRCALDVFTGRQPSWSLAQATMAKTFEGYRPDSRETFWPACAWLEKGRIFVRLRPWQSSGDLVGLAGSNALTRIPGGKAAPEKGKTVEVLLTGHLT